MWSPRHVALTPPPSLLARSCCARTPPVPGLHAGRCKAGPQGGAAPRAGLPAASHGDLALGRASRPAAQPWRLTSNSPLPGPQVKTPETDGYSAVQVGYNQTYAAKINKPELGHLAKSGAAPLRELQEFRVRGCPG